eukprot:TRINITY_DN2458_c0_g1_i1.p2 TRINITY_DN2458_c0_g1~~TRINITY_DN2458_c0_g1_i1.p2  ORF type:complete len:196 (-),score=26.50 TRINITY_DN2458_c0_g1_i1:267-854(-)
MKSKFKTGVSTNVFAIDKHVQKPHFTLASGRSCVAFQTLIPTSRSKYKMLKLVLLCALVFFVASDEIDCDSDLISQTADEACINAAGQLEIDSDCQTLFSESGTAEAQNDEDACPAENDLKACTEKYYAPLEKGDCKNTIKAAKEAYDECFKDTPFNGTMCPGGSNDYFFNDAMTSVVAPMIMALFAGLALYTML